MKVIKKYTAIMLHTKTVNYFVDLDLTYGEITGLNGDYYDREVPQEEFDTEQEAIEYAYKMDSYSKWLILPVVRFDNFE